MIEGYRKLSNGVIEKIEKNRSENTKVYPKEYNSLGELSNYMGYLRLGFIFGQLQKYPESILDIGYGNGDFLKSCSNIIPKCYGIDVTDYPVPEKCIKIDSPKNDYFEVITFFDSLEHFEDPTFISNLNCSFICISVPWCHYNEVSDQDAWIESWKHLKPTEHFWHFDKNSLIKFMKENGYDFMGGGNLEDVIRKPKNNLPNILTCFFKKIINHNEYYKTKIT